jgi:hypothetical protein
MQTTAKAATAATSLIGAGGYPSHLGLALDRLADEPTNSIRIGERGFRCDLAYVLALPLEQPSGIFEQ